MSFHYMMQEWYDERLRWDVADISLNDVSVQAKDLWLPEFASINGYAIGNQ